VTARGDDSLELRVTPIAPRGGSDWLAGTAAFGAELEGAAARLRRGGGARRRGAHRSVATDAAPLCWRVVASRRR
jgi:hypothetical protein